MSLVNEMLRDLDKRRQSSPEAQASNATRAPAPRQLQSASNTRWLPLGLLVLLVLAGAAGLWLYDNPQLWPGAQSEPVASAPRVAATTPPPPKAAEPIAVIAVEPEVQLTAVEWTRQPLLVLQLTLNQAPTQRVLVSTPRTLRLDLGPVGSALELPASGSALIRSAQFVNLDGHLTLELETQQAASFRVVGLNANNQHRLALSIEPQSPLAPQGTAATAKAPAVVGTEMASAEKASTETLSAAKLGPAAGRSAAAEPVRTPTAAWRKTAPQSVAQRDQAAVAQALENINSRRLPQAQQLLETLLLQHPDALSSRTLLATLYIGAQQLDQAEQLIDTGLALDPTHAGLRKLRARLLIQRGALPAAIALLSDSQPGVQDDPEFHQLRAAALQAAGKHQQAAEAYHNLLQTRASEPSWWIGLALSLEALNKPEQAKQAYQNVFKIPQVTPVLADFVSQRLVQLGG